MTRLAGLALSLVLTILAASAGGSGHHFARATHDGHIHQVSVDVGPPGTNVGVTDNGLPAVVDRDGDGIPDAEGYDTPDPGDAPGICGNGIDDDLADSDADTIPDTPDGSIDDGCQVTLGALETCIEIIDDGVLNADEDTQVTGQDRASIDITLGDQPGPGGGVPPARRMSAVQYTLQWDVDVLDVDVQNPNFLILAAGGGQPFTLVVPSVPVTASPFVHAVNDAGPKESGAGVLARLSIEGNAPGLATLSLNAGGTLVQDAVNVGIPINTLNTAHVAVSKDVDGDTTIGNIPGESFGCPQPADVELLSATTTAPAGATAGAAFNVDVDADIRNNGPADPISGNVAVTLNMPADCNAAGGNTRNQTGINLPATVTVPITTETFSVTCTAPSFHDFTATAIISSASAIGDNPANNTMTSAPSTSAVTSTSDVGVGSVTITAPAGAVTSAAFNLDVNVALDNNGPDPASANVEVTLGLLPDDCTTTTANPQAASDVAVPVGTATAAATATFSITCTVSYDHGFSATVALLAPPLHATDTNPNNDAGGSEGTIPVSDAADLKVTSVGVTVRADTSVGTAFNVGANVAVHNNGPSTPANADVSSTLALPSDCSTSSPNPAPDAAVALEMSTSSTLPHSWSVTCTQATNHSFVVNSTIALSSGQPNVIDPNAGNDDSSGQGSTVTTVADSDGDGVPDHRDQCPDTEPGAQVDSNGCSHIQVDFDLDNVCDPGKSSPFFFCFGSDNCPSVPNTGQQNLDGDELGDACDLDDDNDTAPDLTDNCPLNPNADQRDMDGDGLGDVCDPNFDGDGLPNDRDPCPTQPEDYDGFQDPDGCPDYDNDSDGVCDPWANPALPVCAGSDSCPNVPETYDSYRDDDGCPDPDNDADGYPDSRDDCPGTDFTAGVDRVADSGDEPLDTHGSPIRTKEDYDGVLDTDGCHDSPGADYDGDGWTDDAEVRYIGTNAARPCGIYGWPADLVDNDNRLTVADFTSFLFPLRPDGSFNKFGHPVPDPQDTNLKRWDLDADGVIAIGDINALNPAVLASTARPPMFGGQPAFFTNGGQCPYPP